jgi:hypothetical protein
MVGPCLVWFGFFVLHLKPKAEQREDRDIAVNQSSALISITFIRHDAHYARHPQADLGTMTVL